MSKKLCFVIKTTNTLPMSKNVNFFFTESNFIILLECVPVKKQEATMLFHPQRRLMYWPSKDRKSLSVRNGRFMGRPDAHASEDLANNLICDGKRQTFYKSWS
jgi:hypothetical protein